MKREARSRIVAFVMVAALAIIFYSLPPTVYAFASRALAAVTFAALWRLIVAVLDMPDPEEPFEMPPRLKR